ncbi:hypothetical protein BJ912DRAFT_1012360 [Pholiota molesta]|nr:hypothetical protein BJ912DRAFT_1012360 [Pholiota molesta]
MSTGPLVQSLSIDNIEALLGSLLIGIFVSAILFGVLSLQTYRYFAHCSDSLALKFLVAGIWLGELSHSICAVHYFHFFIVQQIRRSEGRTWTGEPPESVSLSIMLSGIIAPSIHIFFAYRVRVVSAGKAVIIPLLCTVASLASFGFTMLLAFKVYMNAILIFDINHEIQWVVTAVLGICAAVDVVLAAALCFHLQRIGQGVVFGSTARKLRKLIIWTIETGVVTSFTGLTLLFTFLFLPRTFAWQALFMCLTRVLSISLLVSLNARREGWTQEGRYLPQNEKIDTSPDTNFAAAAV